MGIPKFFRWMSERYPLCSELISGNSIPEFDNLYLDMNGIVHNCSHGNDPNRQITENQMFIAMFDYIDHLFQIIQPKHLFYMAIDGVAPRAKMNQQRSRRFRTAHEAQLLQAKILAEGEQVLQTDSGGDGDLSAISDDEVKAIATNRFDSNCITPGTPFMKDLTRHLQYFVRKKMTEDSKWRNIRVILSGPEVAGEGEHKIMEYIRHSRAQPDYDPNIRHCLYGLDADLIMLGLVTHEPHFSLLREEVVFGKEALKRAAAAGLHKQKFFLMHLSLMREYIGHEFEELQDSMQIAYDQERIIDDFILLSLFVGNDFIPHLPHLHINEGALSLMFDLYKSIMRDSKHYLHCNGRIHVETVLRLLKGMIDPIEREALELQIGFDQLGNEVVPGSLGPSTKFGAPKPSNRKSQTKVNLKPEKKVKSITDAEKRVLDELTAFVNNKLIVYDIEVPNLTVANFLEMTCFEMKLVLRNPALNPSTFNLSKDIDTWPTLYTVYRGDVEETADAEADKDRVRYLKKLRMYKVVPDEQLSVDIDKTRLEARLVYDREWAVWKRDYYTHKLEFKDHEGDGQSSDILNLVCEYLRGLQWVLLYYYDGVASWGWYYPYHYAPHISDIVRVDPNAVSFQFDFGKPFRPFEQLMGVLPAFSRRHIPPVLQSLMVDPNSPIIDFYPTEFELDMNGKKADWESVVKIPFIDQTRLLDAITSREDQLTPEERKRNTIGTAFVFTYSPVASSKDGGSFRSTMPGLLPKLTGVKCVADPYMLPPIPLTGFKYGLCDGLQPMAGFPSLHLVQHTVKIAKHGIQVFQYASQSDTAVISVTKDQPKVEYGASILLGKSVFVNWPFLVEGTVDYVANTSLVYSLDSVSKRPNLSHPRQWTDAEYGTFVNRSKLISKEMSKRFGVVLGPVLVMVGVRLIRNMKRTSDGATRRVYHSEVEWYPWQMVVDSKDVGYVDKRYQELPALPISSEFPVNTRIFYLGKQLYGCPGMVASISGTNLLGLQVMEMPDRNDLTNLGRRLVSDPSSQLRYYSAYDTAKRMGISSMALSRLTSSLLVVITQTNNKKKPSSTKSASPTKEQRWNLGLQMKYGSKKTKILGYTRKDGPGWEYSAKALDLIMSFCKAFPEFVDRLNYDACAEDPGAMYLDTDFYPNNTVASLHAIRDWLRKSPVVDFIPVPLEVTALVEEEVRALESAVQKHKKNRAPVHMKMHHLNNVSAQLVLKSEFSALMLHDQKFACGDRVICVSDCGKAPFGAYGYVVGCNEDYVEVMFDETFLGATDLNGRCSELRGLIIRGCEILNLSTPQGPLTWLKAQPGSSTNRADYSASSSSRQSNPRTQTSKSSMSFESRPPLDGAAILRHLKQGPVPSALVQPIPVQTTSQNGHSNPNILPRNLKKNNHQPTSSNKSAKVLDGAKLLNFLQHGHVSDVPPKKDDTQSPKRPATLDGKALEMSLKQLLNLGGVEPRLPVNRGPSSSSMTSSKPSPPAPSISTHPPHYLPYPMYSPPQTALNHGGAVQPTNPYGPFVWPYHPPNAAAYYAPPVVQYPTATSGVLNMPSSSSNSSTYRLVANLPMDGARQNMSESNAQAASAHLDEKDSKKKKDLKQFLLKSGKYHGQRGARPSSFEKK